MFHRRRDEAEEAVRSLTFDLAQEAAAHKETKVFAEKLNADRIHWEKFSEQLNDRVAKQGKELEALKTELKKAVVERDAAHVKTVELGLDRIKLQARLDSLSEFLKCVRINIGAKDGRKKQPQSTRR
jgi:chromosome segregation ATPase